MSVRVRIPLTVGLLLSCMGASAFAAGPMAMPPGGNPCGFAAAPPAQAVAAPVYPGQIPGGAVVTMVPPPPPPAEMQSPQPNPMMQWQRGYYIWTGSTYAWRPGQWVMPPRPGMGWRDPQWQQRGNQWVYTPGSWGQGGGVAMPPSYPQQPPMYPQQPPGYPQQPPAYPQQPPMYPQPGFGGRQMGMNIGGSFGGQLQPGDTVLPTGALADDYGIMLQAGQTITIDVTGGPSTSGGGNLDMYLSVLQNGRELAHDDDGGGNLNPHLVFTAPMAGQYVLRLTTYGSRMQTGSYTVRTTPGAMGAQPQPQYGNPCGGGYPPPPQPPQYGNPCGGGFPQQGGGRWHGGGGRGGMPYAIGSMVQGALQQGDQQLEDGSVGDDYNVFLQAGQTITVVTRGGPSMTRPGSNLDVYTLILQNGRELTHDDDSAGSFNSRIVFTAPQPGMYTIRVTTYGSGLNQGQYTLVSVPGANPGMR